jgi:hypothetical protein
MNRGLMIIEAEGKRQTPEPAAAAKPAQTEITVVGLGIQTIHNAITPGTIPTVCHSERIEESRSGTVRREEAKVGSLRSAQGRLFDGAQDDRLRNWQRLATLHISTAVRNYGDVEVGMIHHACEYPSRPFDPRRASASSSSLCDEL